ncbi:hypothetical protein ACKI1I_14885 [Streptomyces turgidiscabies]|uniref:Uncharacterized protein n=1 Tax=Streptomyces turgidiscabies (strain Car8) TaxID=698760 RepID=L7F9V7_STRT8|nr:MULTISPECIES: hypothetical protein [Streptomyces]ELP67836.1 hypothetical protein STRTUCAR8_06322 [Streptomyces turgidiscabies Car8]MDX3493164.1 hypothetical protein [Streptomyces turgidiscabies]GAQ70461.1 hypothetical protein T45_02196 [Streptomyces turgidiscabies]
MEPTPPNPTVYDVTLCVEELRAALGEHGITLPSLRVDLPSFAGSYPAPTGLLQLGGCNALTARKLAAVLRGAAAPK